ncbi:hypothetical protein [Methylocapsa aurea]|uniref:hypothetical protein n=1 Tax=Methylocapsa aurea TaxID=663610 RepID=UPI0012EB2A57|nr:hypothetical protein [Methylocapsa aurea]
MLVLKRIVSAFREIDLHMQMTTALTLLEIAKDEGGNLDAGGKLDFGPSVTQLAARANVSQQSMTHLLRVLETGKDARGYGHGLKFIETFKDPQDARTKRVRLSDMGRRFLRDVITAAEPKV